MQVIACPADLPAQLCANWDVFLYLLPSLVFAVILRLLTRIHAIFFLFYLAGTFLHELAHFCAGLATNARPVSFSVWPRRAERNRWILGSVSFTNIRWYNAMFVGLAPIIVLLVPPVLAVARLQYASAYGWLDILLAVLMAPAYISCVPSRSDWLIALRSWPYVFAALFAAILFYRQTVH